VPKPIVLCFGTLDDDDVVEQFVEYHLSCGIDAFVATDVGSTDRTLDILERYEASGRLHLTRLQNPEIGDVERDWGSAMIPLATRHFGAGTCVFADADEFWVFPNMDAHAYFSSASPKIAVFPRYNVLPTRDARSGDVAHFTTFDLAVRRPLEVRYDISQRDTAEGLRHLLHGYPPEILRSVLPKVAATADAISSVCVGYHDVVSLRPDVPRLHETVGYVAHYPARSFDQWRRKAEHVARFTEKNSPDDYQYTSAHWVRLCALLKAGRIDEDFNRQILSDSEIDLRLAEGVLKRDDAIARRFADLSSASAPLKDFGVSSE
jgi:Glycosyl transferase family 2